MGRPATNTESPRETESYRHGRCRRSFPAGPGPDRPRLQLRCDPVGRIHRHARACRRGRKGRHLHQGTDDGEGTSCRNNNYVWAFNIDTRKLSRILSAPMNVEATGLTIAPDYNGYVYIMSSFHHPRKLGTLG
jgi:hypothetical protein